MDFAELGKRAAACRRVYRQSGRTVRGPGMAAALKAVGSPTQGHAGAVLQPSGHKVNVNKVSGSG